MSSKRRTLIAVDWDGTCVYGPSHPQAGEWYPGAREALDNMLFFGADVTIFTDRARSVAGALEVRARLDEAGLQGVTIWTEPYKPPYHRLVDNRAVRFRGDWAELRELIW